MAWLLGAAELFLPTLAGKEAPPVLINRITQVPRDTAQLQEVGGEGD